MEEFAQEINMKICKIMKIIAYSIAILLCQSNASQTFVLTFLIA